MRDIPVKKWQRLKLNLAEWLVLGIPRPWTFASWHADAERNQKLIGIADAIHDFRKRYYQDSLKPRPMCDLPGCGESAGCWKCDPLTPNVKAINEIDP